ncbi:MAG: hypothetical protein QOH26_2159 [Actinomycetota bacterium]|nr:hypothetical protein [Actinomycetota bacterium]
MVGGRSVGVSVTNDGETLYSYRRRARNAPASNEKLLLSMALLERVGREFRIETSAGVTAVAAGVVPGNLWILGHGDPTVTGGGRYAEDLAGIGPTRLGILARKIKEAGITSIEGSVIGATGYFERDWWAPGWEASFPSEEVALPTALAFNGNQRHARHVSDPEKGAAEWLTKKLRSIGVKVTETPRAGRPPRHKEIVATIRSETLPKLMRFMNRNSSNFFAEVLGKRLAVENYDGWGSIADGARAIEAFARGHGTTVEANDSSGLSYRNHVSATGMTKLLTYAEAESWGPTLMSTLPAYGEGTLEDRPRVARIRAKTGTLDGVSTLSGWVWLQQAGEWGEFSILSHGMDKSTAAQIEDRIVRIVSRYGGPRSSVAATARAATTSAFAAAYAVLEMDRPLGG